MARAFAEIAFTPSVKAAQVRYGSRRAYEGFDEAENPRNALTSREAEFLAARDGFYQASVSETGWPYASSGAAPRASLRSSTSGPLATRISAATCSTSAPAISPPMGGSRSFLWTTPIAAG